MLGVKTSKGISLGRAVGTLPLNSYEPYMYLQTHRDPFKFFYLLAEMPLEAIMGTLGGGELN